MRSILSRAASGLALLCLLLVSCSPLPTPEPTALPTVAPSPVPTRRPTPQPAATRQPQPTAPPGALVVWAVAEGPRLDALRHLLDDIGQAQGFEIQVVGKSADDMQSDLRAAQLAGLPLPDMLWASQDDLGIVQAQGLLRPADDGLDAGAFIPATVAGATLAGQRWGTPVAAQGALLLLYNKKLVDHAPRSSDELIVSARAQTRGDHYGLMAAWAEPRWLVAWLTGMGGAALGSDSAPTLDTPQMLAALNLLKELRASGPPSPSTYADGVGLFEQGRAAYAIDGDWSLEGYRQYTDTLDLGIAAMPTIPGSGRIAAAPLGGIYLMYTSAMADAQLERAHALSQALAQPDTQARIARELGLLPALRAALSDAAVRDTPELAAAAAQADLAAGLPPIRALRCAWSAIGAELPPVLMDEVKQEEAGALMQSSAQSCLAAP